MFLCKKMFCYFNGFLYSSDLNLFDNFLFLKTQPQGLHFATFKNIHCQLKTSSSISKIRTILFLVCVYAGQLFGKR